MKKIKFSNDLLKCYKDFLDNGKTERECVSFTKKMLDENGFKCVCEYETLNAGDKVYYINRDKSIYMAIIGKEKLENANINLDRINEIKKEKEKKKKNIKNKKKKKKKTISRK